MKKLILAVSCALVLSGAAQANTANLRFEADVPDSCTISAGTPGLLAIQNGDFVSSTQATATVSNNSAGKFNLHLDKPVSWSQSPTSYSGTTTFVSGFTVTGVNSVGTAVNDAVLTNSGDDTASVDVSAMTDASYTAGHYEAIAVLTCNAI